MVGMDTWFLLLHDNPDVAHAILRRIVAFMERTSEIMFEKAGPYIDICFTGDDYGFQTGPMMNPRLFDEFARPYLQRMYDVGKRNGKLVMHHSCGSVAKWIRARDGAEHTRAGAGRGGRHGRARTGCAVWREALLPWLHRHPAHAAVRLSEDVRREVRDRFDTFRACGGFTVSPSQHLMTDIPVENMAGR